MKRILYFVPTFSNLSETFILREIEELDKLGNLDIHVVSLKEGKALLPESLVYKVTYIKLSYLDAFKSFSFIFKNLKKIYKVFRLFMKDSEDSTSRKLKNFTKGVLYGYKLNVFSFDHLHIHFLSDISTIISISALVNGKTFSCSGHARDIFMEGSSINFKVRNSKFVTVCNTKAYLRCIELSGGKGRRNLILGFHGVGANKYKFKNRKFSSTGEINVLTDGRFTEKKGLIPLSEAIVTLIKDYSFDINFTIIGLAVSDEQFEHLNKIKDIFKKAKLFDRLYIPGNGKGVQQDEVVTVYNNSDMFIYAGVDTGTGDLDGVPNGLLQAAYSGLPVITTLSGSISDLFNETNSYIVNQNDSSDIVDKFNKLLLDKSRDKKSEKLYNEVSDQFDLEKNTKLLENLFLK